MHCDHSFLIYTAYLFVGLWGSQSKSQLTLKEKWGTPWAGYRCIAGVTQRQTIIHIHSYGQFRVASYPNLHVFGLGEKTGMPG